jgi:hypothetical protein
VHPTTTNTKKGFRVYKTNDGLTQVFMRIDFGSTGATGGNGFAMWATLGTGSDGAGNITGVFLNGGSTTGCTFGPSAASVIGNTNPVNCYGSASPGRFQLALFVSATASNIICVSLERTKDSTGADTSEGLLLTCTPGNTTNIFGLSGTSACVSVATLLLIAGGVQPTPESGLTYVLTRNDPSDSYGNNVGFGLVIHFKGVSVQPGVGMCVVNASDVGVEGSFSAVIYGATRTFQNLNSLLPCRPVSKTTNSSNPNQRMCIRYD